MPLDDDTLSELQRSYLAAIYRWRLRGHWHAIRIGQPAPEIERAFPLVQRFGLLSAWNPHSAPRAEEINRADDERLYAAIHAQGRKGVHAFASAPDRSWREPSWVVLDIDVPELDALARRFGQLGTLHWQRGEPVRLRMDATRPDSLQPHPFVDWIQ
ncbi:DUF3293 domain-containing protein [Luteimonas salinilitoris]|uniref:DUF3293 domain-containing protein n=1 Tax=Luteimonas salinilitoris TaxID=3237697 RepID=A0ABV4HM98_9GAMM